MRPRSGRAAGDGAPGARRTVASALALLLLSCSSPRSDPVQQFTMAADSADQLMIGVRMYLTGEGVRQAYVEADTAFVYENSGRTELKRVRVTFFRVTTGEEASVLTADEGTYLARSGAMEARGNCVVVTAEGARLTSSVLRFDQARNEVSTDQPYTYASADRNLQGNGFVSDPSFVNIRTQDVRGTAGRFTLPGQ